MDSIFNYHNINFPLSDFIQSSTTFNNLSIELDQNYVVKDYEDIIYLQLFQTSTYYYYAREYKKALALLSQCFAMGYFFGPFISGRILDLFGYASIIWLSISCCCIIVFAILLKRLF